MVASADLRLRALAPIASEFCPLLLPPSRLPHPHHQHLSAARAVRKRVSQSNREPQSVLSARLNRSSSPDKGRGQVHFIAQGHFSLSGRAASTQCRD
jgi:hypothetical protein